MGLEVQGVLLQSLCSEPLCSAVSTCRKTFLTLPPRHSIDHSFFFFTPFSWLHIQLLSVAALQYKYSFSSELFLPWPQILRCCMDFLVFSTLPQTATAGFNVPIRPRKRPLRGQTGHFSPLTLCMNDLKGCVSPSGSLLVSLGKYRLPGRRHQE